MITKRCGCCKLQKDLSDFHNSSATKDGKGYRCKLCDSNARKKWHKDHPERARQSSRNRNLKSRFGITREDYNNLLKDQNYKCAICGTDDPKTTGTPGTWCVDHCHITGRIRGLLCARCNGALGLFSDNKELLYKAIRYLNQGECH